MSEVAFLDPAWAEAPYRHLLLAGKSLEPAVVAARQLHAYAGEGDLAALAARLLHRVNEIHALVDGNKRASVVLADRFLALNGHRIEGTEDELVELVWDVAANRVGEQATVERLRRLIAEGAPDAPFDERYPGVIERLAR